MFLVAKCKQKPSKILNVFKPIPQVLKNVKVKNQNIINNNKVRKVIKEAENNIFNIGRVLVRKSGTEPIIRVMGESHNYGILKKNINNIVSIIKKYS